MIRFREARREDVPAVVGLLADDALGAAREGTDSAPDLAAFDAMQAEAGNILIVGEERRSDPGADGHTRGWAELSAGLCRLAPHAGDLRRFFDMLRRRGAKRNTEQRSHSKQRAARPAPAISG